MKINSGSRGLNGGTRPPDGFRGDALGQTRPETGSHPWLTPRYGVILFGLILCALAGCATSPPPKTTALAPLVARFYLETTPGEIAVAAQLPQSGVSLGIAPKPVFSEFDIDDAELARVELGLCLLVRLTPAAKRDLYRLSVQAQGRRLVLSLNGAILGVHRIERAMADGVIPVFVEVPDEKLPGIVAQLKSTSAEIARVANKTANK